MDSVVDFLTYEKAQEQIPGYFGNVIKLRH